ncbi:MAG: hypothetical protein PHU46_12990 [Rhodocyclaceae bacterium]|nr:hypothetical protein [Rhodocyclaceae bacterium]
MTTKKLLFIILAVTLAALALPFVYRPAATTQPGPGLPWEVEALADGNSRVFGLVLGKSTLAETTERLHFEPQLAIIAGAEGEAGTLEAYFDSVSLGFITGKMVVTASLSPEALLAMQKRAVKMESQASGAHRFVLGKADWQVASVARINSISLLPSASLDEAIVLSRFGRPSERLKTSETNEHFLYPERGLDVSLDSQGKNVLQYVPPAQFSRLREPLVKRQ